MSKYNERSSSQLTANLIKTWKRPIGNSLWVAINMSFVLLFSEINQKLFTLPNISLTDAPSLMRIRITCLSVLYIRLLWDPGQKKRSDETCRQMLNELTSLLTHVKPHLFIQQVLLFRNTTTKHEWCNTMMRLLFNAKYKTQDDLTWKYLCIFTRMNRN